jgi:hypothetical protein
LSTSKPKRTADSAVGPVTGYLFQFEKALLSLSDLESSSDYVSIEQVDDVATHSAEGTVISTIQLKHSIAISGSTFEDTSTALWRTLEIWLEKLENKTFNNKTSFVCSTNKKIPITSLVYKMTKLSFEKTSEEIKALLKNQEQKLKEAVKKDASAGTTIKDTIRLIKLVLKKKEFFRIIKKNLSIADEESVMEKFLNNVHLGADEMTPLQKENIYQAFYGWIVHSSKARWLNDKEAMFTKKSFDNKWFHIRSNSSIINAIFRTKESLGTISENDILKKQTELFVRQIDDIERKRDAKARIIRQAIRDFIMSELELEHVVEKGSYTREDFNVFLNECCDAWQKLIDQKILKEINEYSEVEKNRLAIEIFDGIMSDIQLEFKDGFRFNTKSVYMRNGCFLSLSNMPKIGWHPEWEKKYKRK